MSSSMEETPVDESCHQDDFLNGGCCSGESLYELMPKIPIYDSNGEGSITDSERVPLDTNRESLISPDESECKTQRSNQYMESVKYSGYEGEFDYSSDEDSNGECCPAVGCGKENCLCKLCCSSYLVYDSNVHCTKHVHPLFKYAFPYEPPTPLPLLQLYCQRCEENYNLDIDIVLIYVNSVIDQLKKISKGEYLTKGVKERWTAVKCEFIPNDTNATNAYTEIDVTSNCESFRSEIKDLTDLSNGNPLKTETNNECQFECETIIKEASRMLTDSEEREMTVMRIEDPDKEHPTQSVRIQDNLQITLKMEPSLLEYFFWRIDTLKKLEEREMFNNGDKTTKSMLLVPTKDSFLELPKYLKSIEQHPRPSISKIVNITELGSDTNINVEPVKKENNVSQNSSQTTVTLADVLARLPKNIVNSKHSPFNPTSGDELKVSILNLDIQPCLEEERNEEIQETATKSKSNIFKSPYENQSLTLEEKRRKRLLAIRDNRDKKKTKIINEQVEKFRRNVRSRVTASKSVTKLSITNKSFYNSIFGQHNKIINTKNLKMKTNCKYLKKDKCLRDTLRQKSKERVLSPTSNRIKVPSEVKLMLRDLVESKAQFEKSNTQILKPAYSPISSLSSNSIHTKNIKLNLLSENESAEKFLNHVELPDSIILHNTKSMHQMVKNNDGAFRSSNNISFTKISMEDCKMLEPIDENDRLSEKKYPSRIEVECRESIGKIYDLMRKLGTTDKVALKNTKTKFTTSSAKQQVSKEGDLRTWDSESGGSCKQYSNTSIKSLSAEKLNKIRLHKLLQSNSIKEPKVIIKSKGFTNEKKLNAELTKEKNSKKINSPTLNKPMPPNPLPAITKVLNEMNNLQRAKEKIKQEQHQLKYANPTNRDYSKKSPRLERHYIDRNEKVINRMQENRDKRSKMFYKLPDTVIEKNRAVRRTSVLTDEEREARGEAVRGPPTSRLDALAQPRQSYVRAHSEQITSKYGHSVMTDRLQRFVHVQQSHPPVTYQQYVKVNNGFANENKPSVTRNPAAEKCKLQRSSTFVEPKTLCSTSREGSPFKRNSGAITSPRGNTTPPNSNSSWTLAPKPKQEEVNTWIPLISKTSEHYEVEKEEELQTLIDKFVKSQQINKQLKVNRENDHEHCAAKGNVVSGEVEPVFAKAGIAKVKNGKVIIETEDLVDSDIHSFSDCPRKNLHFENPPLNYDNKVNTVTTLERVNTDAFVENSEIDKTKQNVIISNLPHNNVSLNNILVFQAGDANNTALACKSNSMQNFFNTNRLQVKSHTNLHDLQGLICSIKRLSVWDAQPVPRQISNVYYSFPEICAPKVIGKSKTFYTASMIDMDIVHRSTEYMVSSTTHQSQIDNTQHSERSKQAEPDNTEDSSIVTNSFTTDNTEDSSIVTNSVTTDNTEDSSIVTNSVTTDNTEDSSVVTNSVTTDNTEDSSIVTNSVTTDNTEDSSIVTNSVTTDNTEDSSIVTNSVTTDNTEDSSIVTISVTTDNTEDSSIVTNSVTTDNTEDSSIVTNSVTTENTEDSSIVTNSVTTDNTEDSSIVTNSVTNTGVEIQLDSTSSIDVLFKLLNEIHSISMGTMQVASVYGFQMVENVKPLQYATNYNTMSTTEEAIVGYTRHKDMHEVEYELRKTEGSQAIYYEDSLMDCDLRTNELKDKRLNQSLHTLLSPNKGTSVTGLNIESSPNDDTMVGDANVKCKKSNKVKRHGVKVIKNEASGKVASNTKLKRDILIYVYGILILVVFAAMSVPGIYSIHS